MMIEIEKLLFVAADMQRLSAPADALTALLRGCGSGELVLDELDMVAAAASMPSYEQFLKRLDVPR